MVEAFGLNMRCAPISDKLVNAIYSVCRLLPVFYKSCKDADCTAFLGVVADNRLGKPPIATIGNLPRNRRPKNAANHALNSVTMRIRNPMRLKRITNRLVDNRPIA